jgi:predicted SAM-dependent methyltransferase
MSKTIKKRIKRALFSIARIGKRKVIIGCANTRYRGWLASDIDLLDILKRSDFTRYFKTASIMAFLAEHVWEHLTLDQAATANKNCYDYLAARGHLRIAVPDGYHPDKGYIDSVKPGGSGEGSDDHKVLYTYKTLTKELEKAGFTVNPLEYWDENGTFHAVDWNPVDGMVKRSSRFDKRNMNGKLVYTSLIVDAVKE